MSILCGQGKHIARVYVTIFIHIVHQPRRYGLGARKTLPSNPPWDYNIVNILCICAILL